LQDMIFERDKKIINLTRMTEARGTKIARIKSELEDCRLMIAESRLSYQLEIDALLKKRSNASHCCQQLEHTVRQQNGSLHNYAEVLKEAAPDSIDSSYVVRMQAQLCKAMHSMGILEHQLEIVKTYCGDVIKLTKEGMNEIIEQRSQMEVSVMNELMVIHAGVRDIEDEFNSKLNRNRKEMQRLEESFKSLDRDSDDEGEDSSDESGEDIEIDDDLLKELVDEKHEEIAKQESKNNFQMIRIKQLEETINALQLKSTMPPQREIQSSK